MSGGCTEGSYPAKTEVDSTEEYRIEGNITEITYRTQHPVEVHSFTFVPEQNYTLTVDGKTRAVCISANDATAYLFAYDKKLILEVNAAGQFDLKLGKITLIFVKKSVVDADGKEPEGIDITIKSDLKDPQMSDWKIVKHGIRL